MKGLLVVEYLFFSVVCRTEDDGTMAYALLLCLITLSLCPCSNKAHEFYVANNDFSADFKKLNVSDVQKCIEECNKYSDCKAFAYVGSPGTNNGECFIEDPSGDLTSPPATDAVVLVKMAENRCKGDCPEHFTNLTLTGGCYYPVLDQELKWEDAEAACQELDQRAHLIRLNNKEVGFLVMLLNDVMTAVSR